MNIAEVRTWAVKGAEQRLAEIAEEARAIFRHFPELRSRARGFESHDMFDRAPADQETKARGPHRRKMSAAGRQAVAERMKRYWAERRAGNGSGQPASAGRKAARRSPKGGRRAMSAEARKRISEAQKARWVKHRTAKETQSPGVASASSAKARTGARKKR